MALFNTLRKKMGNIVVGVVAFSMVAFIATDFLQSNSVLFGGQPQDVGEMDGNTTSYKKFQEKLDDLIFNYTMNTGRSPQSDDIEQLRQEAWQSLILDNVFTAQFVKAGISVTDAELIDMVQGINIDPQIRQFFSDPSTGEFDKQNVIAFLQSLNNAPPQQRQAWLSFEATLKPNRMVVKYENLLEKTKFANKYEAKLEYSKTANASVSYLYVPFFSMPDSLVAVTDSELKSYLSKNSADFQREESKNISYVIFNVAPSAEDTAFVLREISELRTAIENAVNDSLFAVVNSDAAEPFASYTAADLPDAIDAADLKVGFVSEPEVNGNVYSFFKISAIEEGDEAFVKASHILFKADDETDVAKNRAKAEARRVLAEIKKGADFAAMAAQYGTDGTASRGGDLGWFGENGNFVEEFKKPTFAFKGTGLLPDVVETDFGFHIIKVTEAKSKMVYKVAIIEKELFASDFTQNEIYRRADLFANESRNLDGFKKKADEYGVSVLEAKGIRPNDKRLGGIANARSVVFWLFNKGENGQISDVFELDNQYVVAIQTGEQEKGTAQLEDVRAEVTRKVTDEKKAEAIIERLSKLSGSFEDIKTAYGEGARAGNTEVTYSSNSFPGIGFAPEAVGLVFAMNDGETTRPFKVQNGVVIIKVENKAPLADLSDYDAYRGVALNLVRSFKRRESPATYQNIYNALIERADIKDYRYKFN